MLTNNPLPLHGCAILNTITSSASLLHFTHHFFHCLSLSSTYSRDTHCSRLIDLFLPVDEVENGFLSFPTLLSAPSFPPVLSGFSALLVLTWAINRLISYSRTLAY